MKQEKINEEKEVSLTWFLIQCGFTTVHEGRCVWQIMANRELKVDGILLENGGFRYLGGLISRVCGGGYMDYYCACEDSKDVDEIWTIMEAHGAVFESVDYEDITYYWALRNF